VPEPASPQDFNRYAYVRNNPLRYSDPTGHDVADFGGGNYECYGLEDCMIKSVRDPVYPRGHPKAGYLIPRPDLYPSIDMAAIETRVNSRLNASKNSQGEPAWEFSLSGGLEVRKGYGLLNPHLELRKDVALAWNASVFIQNSVVLPISFSASVFWVIDFLACPVDPVGKAAAKGLNLAANILQVPSFIMGQITEGPTSPKGIRDSIFFIIDVGDPTTLSGTLFNTIQWYESLKDLDKSLGEFSSFEEWIEYHK
jgi:hypothetical protein